MQMNDGTDGKKSRMRILARICIASVLVFVLTFIVWPSSFYYSVMILLGGGSNHPYRAAIAIGERGSVFFIEVGCHSFSSEVRDLMFSVGIESYLLHHGGTEEIWAVFMNLVGTREKWKSLTPIERNKIEEYVHGRYYYDTIRKKEVFIRPFDSDKVRWLNVNIFHRPENYGLEPK